MFNFDSLTNESAKNLNPQVLAYVGDAVHSLYIRTVLTNLNNVKSGELHIMSQNYVKASKQSEQIKSLLPILTEVELDIFKRARNYKTQSIAKSSSIGDYKKATGFEAVLGFLYLTKNYTRLNELLALSTKEVN
jgi:ribonuclease-3 family protein